MQPRSVLVILIPATVLLSFFRPARAAKPCGAVGWRHSVRRRGHHAGRARAADRARAAARARSAARDAVRICRCRLDSVVDRTRRYRRTRYRRARSWPCVAARCGDRLRARTTACAAHRSAPRTHRCACDLCAQRAGAVAAMRRGGWGVASSEKQCSITLAARSSLHGSRAVRALLCESPSLVQAISCIAQQTRKGLAPIVHNKLRPPSSPRSRPDPPAAAAA